MIGHSNRIAKLCCRVQPGPVALRDRDMAELLARRSEAVHVPTGRKRIHRIGTNNAARAEQTPPPGWRAPGAVDRARADLRLERAVCEYARDHARRTGHDGH